MVHVDLISNNQLSVCSEKAVKLSKHFTGRALVNDGTMGHVVISINGISIKSRVAALLNKYVKYSW